MFIRRVKKQRSKDSKIFYQYTLAQTSRFEGKVKQRAILYLGSEPSMADDNFRGQVLDVLKAKIFGQQDFFIDQMPDPVLELANNYFQKYCAKYGQDDLPIVSIPPVPKKAEFHNIDIKGTQITEVKSFGPEYLCKQILDKLQLGDCLTSLGLTQQQVNKALISVGARAIYSASEHKTAQLLATSSELNACFGYKDAINHRHLYEISDLLLSRKDQIDKFLYNRITNLFDLEDKLVIFDISNTYFETRKSESKLARYGRSKEKRSDCPIVVFTGVINAQGFIRHSNIYEGNKPDTQTLKGMIENLNNHCSPKAKKTIVMDAGIATEENLAFIANQGYHYVCVSRKRLKDYEVERSTKRIIKLTDRDKNKVVLAVFKPKGYEDTWMYVESEAKRNKETSMDAKLKQRYIEDLTGIQSALTKKGGTKRIEKVWERIGRAKERNNRVSAQYNIEVNQSAGKATAISWVEKNIQTKSDKTKGIYFIRTNIDKPEEGQLWDIYNTIREVESTFRCLKTDLNIRPVHHQKDNRIEGHIYLTILAYQLVNTIRHMLKDQNINYDWNNILRLMKTQTIQTLELPTDKKTIHLRKPSKPIKEVLDIYKATNCKSSQPAIKKYVVYH